LVCPESIGILGVDCKKCPEESSSRVAISCWDVKKEKWAIWITLPGVIPLLFKAAGVKGDTLTSGQGPDIILQRDADAFVLESLPETMGIQRGNGRIPEMDEVLASLEGRSEWAKK
jgi:hypothetical protein